MVRMALLVGIALALVVQVFASIGVQVAVNELINSTDSSFYNGMTYDRFLGPDSKVDPTLQTAIQKVKELETASSCNKMASSALIHTCATLKGDNEAHELMEDTLTEEKSLFAARFAVCELSDSADQSLVPVACESFILTESNIKQKGWFGYGSAKGREKSFPRYPEYDQATRQNRDRCVAALQNNALTVVSYSNAKQTAHQWCSIVRLDIEKDKLLQTHRALTESLEHQNDVLRAHAETLHQQMEATRFLSILLLRMRQDTMDTSEAFREVLVNAQEKFQTLVQNMGVQFQAHLEQAMAAHDAHGATLRAKFDKAVSEVVDITTQHSTDLALARRNDAEEFSGRLFYVVELVEQRILQADNTSREVAVRNSETLEMLQLFKQHLAGGNEVISDMKTGLQELHDEQKELLASVKDARDDVAALSSEVRAVKSCVSAIKSFFAGIYDCILAAASFYGYFIGAGFLSLFLILGGRPILTLAIVSILKLLGITCNKLKELSQLVLLAAGNPLFSALSAPQQWVDWKGALLLISSVVGIVIYSLAVETPTAYWQRWEDGDLSLFEPVNCVAIGTVVVVFLYAFPGRALAFRESGLLQSGEYESYDEKECAV